ncbi:unnamed protein product, partial [marine sediment metagenome]
SIGAILEDEELAVFARAGRVCEVIVSVVMSDDTLIPLYKRDNDKELRERGWGKVNAIE